MRAGRIGPLLAVLLIAVGGSAPAIAAEQSGVAVAVVQASEIDGATGRKVLQATAPVFMGDTVRTGPGGEAQIRLLDETRLVVGPNSLMKIDSFVYSSSRSAETVALNVVRGAFRFITGNSRKNAYSLVTPAATIGVRGTEFDLSVDGQGNLDIALFSGEAQICSRFNTRQCVTIQGGCSVATAPARQPPRRIDATVARDRLIADRFPYVMRQTSLRPEFRVNTGSCATRRATIDPDTAVPTQVGSIEAPPPPPPPPPAEEPSDKGNKGLGNGAESDDGSDATSETNNPGRGGQNQGGGNNDGGNGNAFGKNK